MIQSGGLRSVGAIVRVWEGVSARLLVLVLTALFLIDTFAGYGQQAQIRMGWHTGSELVSSELLRPGIGARSDAVTWKTPDGALWLFGGQSEKVSSAAELWDDLWRYDPVVGQWEWVKGGHSMNQLANFDSAHVPRPENTPGGRMGSGSWVDPDGNLWLFGGWGLRSQLVGPMGDLWKFDVASSQWVMISQLHQIDQSGIYGQQGSFGSGIYPGSRTGATTWTDSSGQFWLFGGISQNISDFGWRNDLWKYSPALNQWAWMKGSPNLNNPGSPGTQGVAADSNAPRARSGGSAWLGADGRLRLFGGNAFVGSTFALFQDLWVYEPGSNQWTWMKGSSGFNSLGVYGTQGVPDADNCPGGRYSAGKWTDSSGDFWLYGGVGLGEQGGAGSSGRLHDVWKYNPAANTWTWMQGTSNLSRPAVHGTLGVEDPGNDPGARVGVAAWSGNDGAGWIFGGGVSPGTSARAYRNDLWRFDTTSTLWTWKHGPVELDKKISLPGHPSSRSEAAGWRETSGTIWMFGGRLTSGTLAGSRFQDLRRYTPSINNWELVSGSEEVDGPGSYGTYRTAGGANLPGSRFGAASWSGSDGRFYLFGGDGRMTSETGYLNDLWVFDPQNGQWTWEHGPSDLSAPNAVFGSPGQSSDSFHPGARSGATTWVDESGGLWLFGGRGFGATGSEAGDLGDLWKYDVTLRQWSYLAGPLTAGTADPGEEFPRNRSRAGGWGDGAGYLWLFGGECLNNSEQGFLADLWRYSLADNNWTRMSGSGELNRPAVYGLNGVMEPLPYPGSRSGFAVWGDGLGNALVFGGNGFSETTSGTLNDCWAYAKESNTWKWIEGDSTVDHKGRYGIPGTIYDPTLTFPHYMSGGRTQCAFWADPSGKLLFFGGHGFDDKGQEGDLRDLWEYRVRPPHDHFADRIYLPGSSGSQHTTNYFATRESWEPVHPGAGDNGSVWYHWNCPFSGRFMFNTAGSRLDTVLAVYSGLSTASLQLVASNDNAETTLTSLVEFDAVAGQTYVIAAACTNKDFGLINLNYAYARPANDDFANRVSLSGTTGTVIGSVHQATREPESPFVIPSDTWYTWRAPSTGRYIFDTQPPERNNPIIYPSTSLGVYQGAHLSTGLTPVVEEFWTTNTSYGRADFMAIEGQDYHIAIGTYGPATRPDSKVALNWGTYPENDSYSSPVILNPMGGTYSGTSRFASSETGEPRHSQSTVGLSVWHRWTAPWSGIFNFHTQGTSFYNSLTIYSGTPPTSLTQVAIDNYFLGQPQCYVGLHATAGTTYWIVVDGYYPGESGRYNLGWGGSLSNDGFAERHLLPGTSGTLQTVNWFATKEAGEPAHAGNPGGASMWWTWSGPRTEMVTFDTFGSSFDTLLAVYTGSTLGGLAPVAANDDSGGSVNSLVSFTAAANTPYAVVVDGKQGTTGSIVINWRTCDDRYGCFVERQYLDFLKRPSDAGGRNFWSGRLCAGQSKPEGVTRGFMDSPEFSSRRGFVSRCYFALQNDNQATTYTTAGYRHPNKIKMELWTSVMGQAMINGLTERQAKLAVISGLLTQPEWTGRAGNQTHEQFVAFVYPSILGRPATAAEQANQTSRLYQQVVTWPELVLELIDSPECTNRYRYATYVVFAYLGLLNRGADAGGFAYHCARLYGGLATDTTFLRGFLNSTEYMERVRGLGCLFPPPATMPGPQAALASPRAGMRVAYNLVQVEKAAVLDRLSVYLRCGGGVETGAAVGTSVQFEVYAYEVGSPGTELEFAL